MRPISSDRVESITGANDFDLNEMHCLARAAIDSGDHETIRSYAEHLLWVAAKGDGDGDGDGDGKRKERDDGGDTERAAKQRRIAAQATEAAELGKTLQLFSQLAMLSAAVPFGGDRTQIPRVEFFLATVSAYLSAYVAFEPNRYVARSGCGLYVRRTDSPHLGGGVYECEVFTPLASAASSALVVFKHSRSNVDLTGKLVGEPVSQPTDKTLTLDEVFGPLAKEFRDTDSLATIGINASVSANGASAQSITSTGGALPFVLDLEAMSLTGTMNTVQFADSFKTRNIAATTPLKQFSALLEGIVTEGTRLPPGEESANQVRLLAREALRTVPSAKFVIEVLGGARSTRSYATSIDPKTRQLVVKIAGFAVEVSFEDFIGAAFPPQLFVAGQPTSATATVGDDDDDDDAVEKDFANQALGRRLRIAIKTGNVYEVQNIVVDLPSIVAEVASTAVAAANDAQQVSVTNEDGPFDVGTAARALATTGTAQLADGRAVDYPLKMTLREARDVVARDDQVTGVADDPADLESDALFAGFLEANAEPPVKRAFVIVNNLLVLQQAEQLTSERLVNDVVGLFSQLNAGGVVDSRRPLLEISVMLQRNGAMNKLFLSENWLANKDEIVTTLYGEIENALRFDRDATPVTLRVSVKSAGGTRRAIAIESSQIVDSKAFRSRFADVPNSVAYVSTLRDNGLEGFSPQFPYKSTDDVGPIKFPASQQPLESPLPAYLTVDRSAPFLFDGKVYHTLRQFEEASRFAGFPDVQDLFCMPLFARARYSQDEEQRLCEATIAAEGIVASAGATILRPKFSSAEFEHAVVSRVFQNYWLYRRAVQLFTAEPKVELRLVPRVVLRFDATIGEYQLSLDDTTPPLFARASETLKRAVLNHVRITANGNVATMLPAPANFALAQQTRPTNSVRVSFVAGAGTAAPFSLFASAPIVINALNANAAELYWRGDLTKLSAESREEVLQLFNKRGILSKALLSNASMFGVHRNKRPHSTVFELLEAEYAGQDSVFDVVNTLGSVQDQRGTPTFKVEVAVRGKRYDAEETVVFRSKQELSLNFAADDSAVLRIALENEPQFLQYSPSNPSLFELYVARSKDGSEISVHGYGIVTKGTVGLLAGLGETASAGLSQRADQQPLGLPRPESALAEDAEITANSQPTLGVVRGVIDIDPDVVVDEMPAVVKREPGAASGQPKRRVVPADPDDDVDDKVPVAVQTEPAPTGGQKKRRVMAVDVVAREREKTYVEEGAMALGEDPAKTLEEIEKELAELDRQEALAKESDSDPEPSRNLQSRAAPSAKSSVRISVKQTNTALVSQPVKVEISDHGFKLVSKQKGFAERTEGELVASQQAPFLHPTYPRVIQADVVGALKTEQFLNAVSQNFIHLMPRRSLVELGKVTKERLALIQKIYDERRAIQTKAEAEIAALESLPEKEKEAEQEKVQKLADAEMEKIKADLYDEFNKSASAKGTKAKSPANRRGGNYDADDDDGDESGEDELADADVDEALAHLYGYDDEVSGESGKVDGRSPQPATFIVDGKKYESLYDFIEKLAPESASASALANAARTRIMQNRALYLSALELNKRLVRVSNQAKLSLVPMVGKGLPESREREKIYNEVLSGKFGLAKQFAATKPLSTLKTPKTSIVVSARRIRLTGDPLSTNVARAVELLESKPVADFIGRRAEFFARTQALKLVNSLLSPVVESADAMQVDGQKSTSSTAAQTGGGDNEEAEEEVEEDGSAGGEKKAAKGKKPKATSGLSDVAALAARSLYDLNMANVDLVVAMNNANSTVLGVLIGGFVDDVKTKTHTFRVEALHAGTHGAAERLLAYAEHTLKYADFAQGSGRKKSEPDSVVVVDGGILDPQGPNNAATVRYAMQLRNYETNIRESNKSQVSALGVGDVVDRMYYLAGDEFSSIYLDWLEDDVVTPEQWKDGSGRSKPLIVNDRLIKSFDKDEESGSMVETPIRVWREAPHPFFVPEKTEPGLQAYFAQNDAIEPTSYLVVKVYALADDNSAWRGLLYASEPAPDWIKMNERIALLPFENWFGNFAANNPETYVDKGDDPRLANGQERLLINDMEAMRKSFANTRRAKPTVARSDVRQELAGATDDELQAYYALEEALKSLREGILYVKDSKQRNAGARIVKFDQATHLDWAPNGHLMEQAVVHFCEPRVAATARWQNVGTVDSLTKTWADISNWDGKEAFGGREEDPLNQPYKSQTADDLRAAEAGGWRRKIAEKSQRARWSAFVRKYKPPQPYTHLGTMLVLAESSAKTLQFEIEEHTFFGNDEARARVVFRSEPVPVASFFDQDLPSSARLRVRKQADGSLVESEANRVVGPDGEKLEEYEGEDDSVFVRTLQIVNALAEQDDERVELTTFRVVEGQRAGYAATVGRANTVKSLEIELNNNLEKDDLQPPRAAIGAFFIDTVSTDGTFAEIRDNVPVVDAPAAAAERLRKASLLAQLGGQSQTDSDGETDVEFESGDADDGPRSMQQLAQKFSQLK